MGSPLHAVRAGYIKRDSDDQLYDTLVSGHFAHVIAPDRSGKSSLIAATAARLESRGYKVAIIDLEQLGVRDGATDSGRWYYSVAYRLLRQLRIRFDLQSWWQDKSVLSNRQRLVEFYSEIVLQHVTDHVVVFIDGIQCIADVPFADQLLASVRAAHNARTTDPDFSRLTFVLLGECDPVSLIEEPEQSPFNVTQQILLPDFSRPDLDLFATEMNLGEEAARAALDRVFYWTNGQPYLSQKLARMVARARPVDNIDEKVDHIAMHQLAGRAALHSEPQMSHIHREIVKDGKRSEPLLNLYGKLRKGIEVPADLGSGLQRRLMAIGLVVIDDDGNLKVRNRLYETLFTARWANENLPTRFKVPAIVVATLLVFALVPFWYTQWLPRPYVAVLAQEPSDLDTASSAYENLRSFPGHADTADSLYRSFLERRALLSGDEQEILALADRVAALPGAGRLADEFQAAFWDRRAQAAVRLEDRDTALLARIRSLVLSTASRRQKAAALIAEDYRALLVTLPPLPEGFTVLDASILVLTTATGPNISQFSYTQQGLQQREPWAVTALEVSPLVRRVIVDRVGVVSRIGLTLNISHARLSDLRIKLIAPSGRTVEVEPGVDQTSSAEDIAIPAAQLGELVGESLEGTWSISVRDESLGIAGRFVGWNLKLNSQGTVENFQRGLNIPDPVERETDKLWFDPSGRYAVARAQQSDSARIWDLSFAEPVRAIALSESETLIGLDAGARRLVTATQDSVNLWDTATGDKLATLATGPASVSATLTAEGSHIFVQDRGDVETRLELWSLDEEIVTARVVVAGAPAHVAIDAVGRRVAVADFDRSVRVWDFTSSELLGQFDLPEQPGSIELSADGAALGVVYPELGFSLWRIDQQQQPLLSRMGGGRWALRFSPSGKSLIAGHPESGFRIYSSVSGRVLGPEFGLRASPIQTDMLAFSRDEQYVVTGVPSDGVRIWRKPALVAEAADEATVEHPIWNPSADRPVIVSPDGAKLIIGDTAGHVHILPTGIAASDLNEIAADVSFLGHRAEVDLLVVDPSSELAASVAVDGTLRVWSIATGEPAAFLINLDGDSVGSLEFSTDSRYLVVVGGRRVRLFDTADGSRLADIEHAAEINGVSFTSADTLYVGAADGSLHRISQGGDQRWYSQQVWQGSRPIEILSASPRGNYLLLVDADNLASQFVLAEGRIGATTVQLPSDVQEVAFDRSSSRVFVRTSRWIHRISASVSGLSWLDARFAPLALNGARMVFGAGGFAPAAKRSVFLPTAGEGFVDLTMVSFASSSDATLFGSRDELLAEWQDRISAVPREESEPAIQVSQP
ncbi:MAG: AAA-like domain-containing protein [Gammaproteobacteria bacterium]|nr:AAA-like domain-containing protein [Gammaproteobacteria bacterium]